MSFAMLIYFIDVICGSHMFLGFLTFFLGMAWVFGFAMSIVAKVDTTAGEIFREQFLSIYKSMWPLKAFVVIMLTLSTLVPSKETAYKMLAAYGVESLVTNPEVQKLGGKSLDVINKAMDEYLKESKPATNNEKVEK
jgi:glucan phosphoethanolaminetransferase (alkaline phosphatase superfamily)